MSGDTSQSGAEGQGVAADLEGGAYPAIGFANRGHSTDSDLSETLRSECHGDTPMVCVQAAGFKLGNSEDARSIGWQDETAPTLNAECGGNKPAVCYGISSLDSNAMKSSNPHSGIYEANTARTLDLNGGNPACNQGGIMICVATQQGGAEIRQDDKAPTLTASAGMSGNNQPIITTYQFQSFGDYTENDKASTVKSRDYKDATDLIAAVDCRNGTENVDINGTLQAKSNGGTSLNLQNIVRNGYSVRRLTPLECERLQGYPDGWTDIGNYIDNGKRKQSSDSARYKALGNSIALPPWRFVMSRICAVFGRTATLGSLFDGIGGFPLIWEEINGKGSARWASEIEPFPIAVTKFRFGED